MSPLPSLSQSTQTVEAIYRHYENSRANGFRLHLGCSELGHDCRRRLWFRFRWALRPSFGGRMLRLFETGDLAELRFAANLRAIGCDVRTVDAETGRQFRVSAFAGHVGGSMDAKILGVPESPGTWHVGEFKTHDYKSFGQLVRKGVKDSKPLHYSQMQSYMHLGGLSRALYLAVNKNTDELYSERVHYDRGFAEAEIAKAGYVINSASAPERISNDPSYFGCKFCDYHAICHKLATSQERNCRTCAFSTPDTVAGGWRCERYAAELSEDAQRAGCAGHVFLPDLVAGEPTESGNTWVQYRMPDNTEWLDGNKGETP